MIRALSLFAFLLLAVVGGCQRISGGGSTCTVVTDCNVDQTCSNGHCIDNGSEGEGEGAAEGEGEGEGQPAGCHNDGECTNGTVCISPDGPAQCGPPPPPPPPNVCSSNTDCSNGDVCDFVPGFCNSGGVDQCIPACGADPGCLPGAQCDCAVNEVCNAGRCETISCTAGFTCPSWTLCSGTAPDPLTDDSLHGCAPIPCAQDIDCPFPIGAFIALPSTGFCVLGVCASGPGVCEALVP